MDTMRKSGEFKFNRIKFHSYDINGSVGKKFPDEFFRSALAQNICCCVRNSVKKNADDMGVFPVYVETQVEFLEEYGFLQVQKDKYIVSFIISEPTAELLIMRTICTSVLPSCLRTIYMMSWLLPVFLMIRTFDALRQTSPSP